MEISKLNQFGAYLAIIIFTLCILIFVARLLNQQLIENWIGILFILTAIPLCYLLFTASQYERSTLYYIQLILMIAFIIIELLLDYVFKLEFRSVKWMVISYAMLFFAGTGGMLGIASLAGSSYMIVSLILYLIMATLTFVQRGITGM